MVDDVEYSKIQLKRKQPKRIDCLLDELLMEILCRLPCHKTAIMCKPVCKRWATLVSQPFFVSRFVAYKTAKNITPYAYENGLSKYDEPRMKMMNDRTFGLVVRKMWGITVKGLIIRFNDPIYNPHNVSLSCLPRLVNEGLPPSLTVVGAYNDLLLYQRHGGDVYYDKFELYISNAQTRQWLALPSLHLQIRTSHIGLICDPYFSSDASNLIPNDAYCACIVVIPYTSDSVSKFPAHLLSPNTAGMWRSVVLSLPLKCKIVGACPLFCIGRKLYFHCEGFLISFDPFVDVNDSTSNGVIKCHSLPTPPGLVSMGSFFGVFHEKLYMCDYDDHGRYRVWILGDYKIGQWSLKHSIIGQDWIPRDPPLAKLVKWSPLFGNAIGFHPVDPDVIYVLSRHWVVLCNLSTRKMEIASKLPKCCRGLFPAGGSFQITIPVWPTPLPTLDIGEAFA